MVYGYARVSTDAQDGERQVSEILTYCEAKGMGAPVIVRETASGAKDRPELEATIARLQKGDTLAVWEWSRLTRRGITELLDIARRVVAKGSSLVETRSGTSYDPSAIGELLLSVTATFDRMERERIAERTRSALRVRKQMGVRLGRPKGPGKSKLDPYKDHIVEMLGYGVPVAKLAKDHGVTEATLHRYLNRRRLRPAR